MEKKNAFTMVELLATIVILGILSSVGTIAVMRYLNKARNDSYEQMGKTVYEAAQNYMLDSGMIENTTITTETLQSQGYLKTLSNPDDTNGAPCSGRVQATVSSASGNKIADFTYKVTITCNGKTKINGKIYP